MSFRSFFVAVLAAVLVLVAAPAAAAEPSVSYIPPVDAPVVDGFRPPSTRYGAGNRGIDYLTRAGDDVHTAADGTVVFAGRIGPSWHVAVLHADGLRTSYSFLDGVAVRRGDRLRQGDVVGVARAAVHFGARAGTEYLDPVALFGGGPPKVHLVPTDLHQPLTEAKERRGLIDSIAGVGAAAIDLAAPVARFAATHGWEPTRSALLVARDQFDRMDAALRALGHVANLPFVHRARNDVRMARVLDDQRECTPANVPTPGRPARGHLLVLVGGRDSSTGSTPLLDIDAAALGYRSDDIVQFSYAGGTTTYTASDTHGDLRTAGGRLRALLLDLAHTHPGITVDVIAHSQGGLVARAAMHGSDTWAPDTPIVGNVVTIDTPHHGAVPATASALLGLPAGDAVRDLSSASRLIDELDRRSLPAGARFTSIAGSGDLVVDAQMSSVDHATNVIVHAEGLHAHDEVPRLPATHRELSLALAGMGPTCRDLTDDLILSDTINLANGVSYVADLVERNLWGLRPGQVHSTAAPGGTGPPG